MVRQLHLRQSTLPTTQPFCNLNRCLLRNLFYNLCLRRNLFYHLCLLRNLLLRARRSTSRP